MHTLALSGHVYFLDKVLFNVQTLICIPEHLRASQGHTLYHHSGFGQCRKDGDAPGLQEMPGRCAAMTHCALAVDLK